MGAVWVALDTRLNREVAIKFPLADKTTNPIVIERFQREARIAASIDHPNFCPVHDVGEDQGFQYYVMPIVPGQALSVELRSGQPWPLGRAAQLIASLASALAELHARGVVHRDLKPTNVMIKPDGNVVLMDFGLARTFEGTADGLTATGDSVGTPSYMAPEQARPPDKKGVGPAADIWALGVILYQLIAGRLPFAGIGLEVFGRILHMDPTPPSEHRPDGDSRLDAVCLQALSKDPDKRPKSMTNFAVQLLGFLNTKEQPAVTDERRTCRHCGKRLKIPAEYRGRKVKCPSCGRSLSPASQLAADSQPTPMPTDPADSAVANTPGVGKANRESNQQHTPLISPRMSGTMASLPPSQVQKAQTRTFQMRGLMLIGVGWCIVLVLVAAIVVYFDYAGNQATPPATSPGGTETSKRERTADKDGSPGTKIKLVDGNSFKNAVGMDLVWIKPGKFQMGSPPTDKDAAADEMPQHAVTIERGFWIASREVTRGQYRQFAKETGHTDTSWEKVFPGETDEQPVVKVSWNDAVKFCEWLSKKEKITYDLPTEAEWEYCCRAGTTTKYSFGNDAAQLGENGWFQGNAGGTTHPVGQKKANPWGLYDMSGSVWEWCKDSKRTYENKEFKDNFSSNTGDSRVVRGGAWYNSATACRCTDRYINSVDSRDDGHGFRVVVLSAPRTP